MLKERIEASLRDNESLADLRRYISLNYLNIPREETDLLRMADKITRHYLDKVLDDKTAIEYLHLALNGKLIDIPKF